MCDDDLTSDSFEEEEMECVCTPKGGGAAGDRKKKGADFQLPGTCPYDPRFPNTNQSRRCYVNFVDYQRCTRLLGDYQGCRIFKICYKALCPTDWINQWEEQLEKGSFDTIYPPKDANVIEPNEDEPFDFTGY